MKQPNRTILHTIGTALIFVSFVCFFAMLAVGMMAVGIWVGITWLFSFGIWATALVVLVVLAVYAAALSIGLALIEERMER